MIEHQVTDINFPQYQTMVEYLSTKITQTGKNTLLVISWQQAIWGYYQEVGSQNTWNKS